MFYDTTPTEPTSHFVVHRCITTRRPDPSGLPLEDVFHFTVHLHEIYSWRLCNSPVERSRTGRTTTSKELWIKHLMIPVFSPVSLFVLLRPRTVLSRSKQNHQLTGLQSITLEESGGRTACKSQKTRERLDLLCGNNELHFMAPFTSNTASLPGGIAATNRRKPFLYLKPKLPPNATHKHTSFKIVSVCRGSGTHFLWLYFPNKAHIFICQAFGERGWWESSSCIFFSARYFRDLGEKSCVRILLQTGVTTLFSANLLLEPTQWEVVPPLDSGLWNGVIWNGKTIKNWWKYKSKHLFAVLQMSEK